MKQISGTAKAAFARNGSFTFYTQCIDVELTRPRRSVAFASASQS